MVKVLMAIVDEDGLLSFQTTIISVSYCKASCESRSPGNLVAHFVADVVARIVDGLADEADEYDTYCYYDTAHFSVVFVIHVLCYA